MIAVETICDPVNRLRSGHEAPRSGGRLRWISAVLASALSGCTTFQVAEVDSRTFVLTAHATGEVAVGYVTGDTNMRAAKLTRERGYAYYKLSNIAFGHPSRNEIDISTRVQMSATRDGPGYVSATEFSDR